MEVDSNTKAYRIIGYVTVTVSTLIFGGKMTRIEEESMSEDDVAHSRLLAHDDDYSK
ncbi:Protein CBG21031 [Caenorhabditis briggsae]|uniref:Protein CBG21031 n=1 Tax=Caenorhabditis briggsae TaxID=6238 RepID=A8XZ77_CAEBR|nr:Protein CBG21031 [Caenorhabditis briggsae]CAP37944.2 Protein CBG21031 [Caenorhabditis briggsae]